MAHVSLSSDPAELFGAENLGDMAALKRSYARLIRQHGPETDPAGFAIIHAAYESARARLIAPPIAPERRDATPVPSRDAAAWTTLLRAAADLDAVRVQLAPGGPDGNAALIDLAIRLALGPDHAGEVLLAEIERRRIHPFQVARAAFALCPRLAREEWAMVARDPRGAGPRVALACARLDVLVHSREWDSAWSCWQEAGPSLIAEAQEAPLQWYSAAFMARIWRRPIEEMQTARAWIQDVHLQLDPDKVALVDDWIAVALDVRAAAGDPAVPPPVVAAARTLLGGDGPPGDADSLMALWGVGSVVDRRSLENLTRTHPVLIHPMAAALGRISGRYRQLDGKEAPPPRRPDLAHTLQSIEDDMQPLAPRPSLEHPVERYFIPIATPLIGVGVLGCAVGNGILAIFGLGAFLLLLGWVIVGHLDRMASVRRFVPKLSAELQASVDSQLLDVLTLHGAWAHEVAAAAEGLHLIGPAVDRLMRDPWADLYGLGIHHVHRIAWERGTSRGKNP
jgi:hypothetical protein